MDAICHCVFDVSQGWNERTVLGLRENMQGRKMVMVKMLAPMWRCIMIDTASILKMGINFNNGVYLVLGIIFENMSFYSPPKEVKRGNLMPFCWYGRKWWYLWIFLFSSSAKSLLLHVLNCCMKLYHTCIFHAVNARQRKLAPFALKQSRGTHPPCVSIKIAVTAIVLHSGYKETQFPLLNSLGPLDNIIENAGA